MLQELQIKILKMEEENEEIMDEDGDNVESLEGSEQSEEGSVSQDGSPPND